MTTGYEDCGKGSVLIKCEFSPFFLLIFTTILYFMVRSYCWLNLCAIDVVLEQSLSDPCPS